MYNELVLVSLELVHVSLELVHVSLEHLVTLSSAQCMPDAAVSAACIFVSIEVMRNSVQYERDNLPKRHPSGSYITHGFAFALAWCSFALFLVVGIIFVVFSGKRKGKYALSVREAAENEPVHLGR